MTLPVDYTNSTPSPDTHPAAHNAVNAAVNALAGATAFLTGSGAPALGLGVVGNYYLDTTNRVLYGPKAAVGAAQQLTLPDTALATNTTWAVTGGVYVLFVLGGTISKVRYYRRANNADAYTIKVWADIDSAALRTVTDTRAGQAGYFDATLPTPLAVSAGTKLRITATVPGSPGMGYNSGSALAVASPAAMTFQSYAGAGGDAWPFNNGVPQTYWVTPLFEPGVVWPVALVGVPPGGTTGQSLKKTSAADYAIGWVT